MITVVITILLCFACVLPANPEGPNAHTKKDEGTVDEKTYAMIMCVGK